MNWNNMLRKIVIAVDCDSEQQATAVQNVMREFCANFKLNAVDLLAIYPAVKKNRTLIKDAVKTISKDGKMGAIKLIPSLMKAFM